MPTVALGYDPVMSFLTNDGRPLAGGLLYTYGAGTSTPAATYIDSTGATPNTNPIVLNYRGDTANNLGVSCGVWWPPGTALKFVLTDSAGNPIWSQDNVTQPLTTVVIPVGSVTDASLAPSSVIYAIDQTYMRTAAEIAAVVTPVNFGYAPGNLIRYGGDPTGVADSTTAIQNWLNVCGRGGGRAYAPAGTYKYTADITGPVGVSFLQGGSGPFTVDIVGDGREQTIFLASGAGFTNGWYFNGASLPNKLTCRISGIRFDGNQTAQAGLTFNFCDMPTIDRCIIRNFAGRGFYAVNSVMPQLNTTYITGCGSASTGEVEIDNCTTFNWNTSYISGAAASCLGGLLIDRTAVYNIIGGAIESTVGPPILIGSKAEASKSTTNGLILGIDMENPGAGNAYIDIGAGLSGAALVNVLTIDNCLGAGGGSSPVPFAIRMQNCISVLIGGGNRLLPVAGTSQYEMVGTNLSGTYVRACRALTSNVLPWVRYNGTQVQAASAHYDWQLGLVTAGAPVCTVGGLAGIGAITKSGATPDIGISAAGGWYKSITVSNGGAVNMTEIKVSTLAPERGMELNIYFADSNTTVVQGAGAGQFQNRTGANFTGSSGGSARFIGDGTHWSQS